VNLALFDLDGTLLSGDSDVEWAQFLISRGVLDREVFEVKNREFFEQYRAGTLDIKLFLDFQLAPLARHPRAELDAWHTDFMRQAILPMIGSAARLCVREHIDRGDLCAIVTATNRFVTAPIAREFGIEYLVATEPEELNGEFTGGISGEPCFREGKITRVEAWLNGLGKDLHLGFERSWFYSDSLNDLPLLERVSNPVAVDPDATLRAFAETRGWPIISLREPAAP
jgi:HAD superfamily hydrolase (TIGR01490 family)